MPEISNSVEVTLALPAYNEEANIIEVLEKSIAFMDQMKRTWEIIVVDNHSNDRTPQKVRDFMRNEPRVRLVVHDENRLYSGSCATAIREAKGHYVAIIDSDGQFSAADLPKFIGKLEKGANLVVGWRHDRHDPLMRLITSAIFNLLGKVWLGYPLHDLNCGIRMFDRKFMEVVQIKHRINMSNPELYLRAKLAGLKLDECAVQHFERFGGVTSHNFSKSWQIFVTVNKYFKALRKELSEHAL
jgi:glycosyltransferase involved in cell wall biosynthesis